jgi:hypothetical protein
VGCRGAIEPPAPEPPPGAPRPEPGPAGAGAPPAGPSSSSEAATGAPGPRVPVELACNDASKAPPPPRRLWRLTDTQYLNTLAVLFKGRRSARTPVVQPPADLAVPLEALGDVYRFGTYSGTHSVTEFEFRRSVALTESIAQRLVAALRTGSCWGTNGGGAMFEACVEALIRDKGAILFRRPLAGEEVVAYAAIARDNAAAFGRDEALALSFQAMLGAPDFLFRTEIGAPLAGAPGTSRLSPFEVASALAYVLTDGPPDEELWDAASKGALATPESIAAQVSRILATAEAIGAREFVLEHFEMNRLLNAPKAKEDYCQYGRPRVLLDARLLIEDVIKSHGRRGFLKELLTTPLVYYGCDSYKVYGLPSQPMNAKSATVTQPAQRAGLLTHPAFLGAFAGFEETLPVRRGVFVNESLLCRHVPEIPIGVVPQLPPRTATTSMRDRLSLHARDAGCAACHALIDPVGLSFEIYDAYGKYRTVDAGKSIDASGVLTGTDVDGKFAHAMELSRRLAESPAVERCFLRHGFRYFMGREEQPYDACTLEAAAQAFAKGGGDYVAFLTALFTSPSFLDRSHGGS